MLQLPPGKTRVSSPGPSGWTTINRNTAARGNSVEPAKTAKRTSLPARPDAPVQKAARRDSTLAAGPGEEVEDLPSHAGPFTCSATSCGHQVVRSNASARAALYHWTKEHGPPSTLKYTDESTGDLLGAANFFKLVGMCRLCDYYAGNNRWAILILSTIPVLASFCSDSALLLPSALARSFPTLIMPLVLLHTSLPSSPPGSMPTLSGR